MNGVRTDEDYGTESGAGYMLSILMSQLVAARPGPGQEETSRFCQEYFERMATCQHVLGQNFATLKVCRYNRRAFVVCCKNAFAQFSPTTMMSTFDHAILVRALCPNIATALLHEIHFLITPLGKEQTRTYNVRDLNFGLFFIILYEEWFEQVKGKFGIDDSPRYLKLNLAISIMESLFCEFQGNFDMPSRGALKHIFYDLRAAFGDDSEISYDTFRRACVASTYLREEMYLLLPVSQHERVAKMGAGAKGK